MFDEIWSNSETALFHTPNGKQTYLLQGVSIERIIWEQSGRAKLILYGPLPFASDLFAVEDDDMLHLLHKECAPYEEYDYNDTIVNFSHCKIKRRWTPHAISISEKQGHIGVYVSLECFYWRGLKWTKTKSS